MEEDISAAEADVRARLELLTARAEDGEVNWKAEAAAAAEVERKAFQLAAAGGAAAGPGEDINEAGWMPR